MIWQKGMKSLATGMSPVDKPLSWNKRDPLLHTIAENNVIWRNGAVRGIPPLEVSHLYIY